MGDHCSFDIIAQSELDEDGFLLSKTNDDIARLLLILKTNTRCIDLQGMYTKLYVILYYIVYIYITSSLTLN